MLGWFKKKFKKQDTEAETPVSEEAVSPSTDAEIIVQPEIIPDGDSRAKQHEPEVSPGIEETSDSGTEANVSEAEIEIDDTTFKVIEPAAVSAAVDILEEAEEEPVVEEEPSIETEEVLEADKAAEQVVEEELEEEIPEEPEVLEEPETLDDISAPEHVEEPVQNSELVEPPAPVEPSEEPPPPAEEQDQPQKQSEKKKKSLFSRLTDRLARTRESFTYQLDTLFLGRKEIDADLMDDLEELLITADLGVSTTEEILDHARRRVKRKELSDPNSLKQVIQDKIKSFIEDSQEDAELVMPDKGPFVIMVVGVNGVGKTTTIGKIAAKFVRSGQSVLLVAADTFRAAAISQLKIWGERNNVPVASQDEGSDPSSVVFDAIAHAKSKQYDVVLVDTAGRLHTQANLMEELKKIKRVMGKQLRGAPHEVLLVIDATTGQNGISQAKLFDAAVDITGIALTKLDGTAKGGIVANISKELKTPIRFIGIGETIDDLRDFDANEFVEALFQNPAAQDKENAA